jgi:hypothetical protein
MNKPAISSTSAFSTSTFSTSTFSTSTFSNLLLASIQNTSTQEIIIKENNVMILLFSLNLVLVPLFSVIFFCLCCVIGYFILKRKGNL